MPGWYPDPAGHSGHYRYWDGAAWSQQTTTDPAATPPPGGTGQPAPQGHQRNGRGLWLAALAALLVSALLVWGLFFRDQGFTPVAEDTNSSSPTGPVWNETDTPTPTPSGSTEPAPSGGAIVDCPTGGGNLVPASGGELHGGGLVVPQLAGWEDARAPLFTLPWTQDMQAQTKTIHSTGLTSWFSVQAVGALPVAEGFSEPRSSASMMMSCFATSGYYSGFMGRKDISSKAVEVDGQPGWHLRTEVYVQLPDLPQVAGDVIDVVVVDTGDQTSLGVYVSSATIGDAETQGQVDSGREAMGLG